MYIAFTVPPVPTGMKAGVRMTPRGMEISPRRALPSVAVRRKVKSRFIGLPVQGARIECIERLNSFPPPSVLPDISLSRGEIGLQISWRSFCEVANWRERQ